MAPANLSFTSQIDHWAARQLADYDAHQPGSLFAEGVQLNVAEGYALQSAVAELRQQRGERVIGYKVGCTSPKIREQLKIDHCITGRLYDTEQHSSGAVLEKKDFANLAIEGELAVELSREPIADDFLSDDLPPCIARVFPVIELHNLVIRGEQPTAGELIAHNAIHAGVVAGPGISPEEATGEPSLSIFSNDQLLDSCKGPALIQTISSSLKWLYESVQTRGDHLSKGQIILTGSIPNLFPIEEECKIGVDAPPFGRVQVEFKT